MFFSGGPCTSDDVISENEQMSFSENKNHNFDQTPQIDDFLNISTPNISFNSPLGENTSHGLNLTPQSEKSLITSTSNISTNIQQNTSDEVISGDVEKLSSLRITNYKNPCISYLNINSLRGNKFVQLTDILKYIGSDILCIDETKLTPDFPTTQFQIEGYKFPPFRRDRTQPINNTHFGGGKIVYIKEDFISNRLNKYETANAETICINLIIKERKWFILFASLKIHESQDLYFNITMIKK